MYRVGDNRWQENIFEKLNKSKIGYFRVDIRCMCMSELLMHVV